MQAKRDELLEFKLKYLWQRYMSSFEHQVTFEQYVQICTQEYIEGEFIEELGTFDKYVELLIEEYEGGHL